MPRQVQQFEYDVALSFAGEHRSKVEQLATLLRQASLPEACAAANVSIAMTACSPKHAGAVCCHAAATL